MTATLTDRYVAETLRAVPEKQRPDLERELRASIADAIEGRIEAGEPEVVAETAVLAELGDPVRLAASFTDRPLYLIGPALFVDYVRFLRVLLSVVVPLTFVGVGVAQFIAGATALAVLGAAFATAFTAAVHIGFWTTALFAVMERTHGAKRFTVWTPAQLPMITDSKPFRNELIGGTIFTVVVTVAVILIQDFSSVTNSGGDRVGPIAEPLWQSGALYLILFFSVARIAFDLVGFYSGWSRSLAFANVILSLLFVIPTVWLTVTGKLYSEEFFGAIGQQGAAVPPGWIGVTTIVLVIYLSVHDTIELFRRARRAPSARQGVSA